MCTESTTLISVDIWACWCNMFADFLLVVQKNTDVDEEWRHTGANFQQRFVSGTDAAFVPSLFSLTSQARVY